MPEGLLVGMSDKAVRDLFAYLRGKEQVERYSEEGKE